MADANPPPDNNESTATPSVDPATIQSTNELNASLGITVDTLGKATTTGEQFQTRLKGIGASSRDIDQLNKSLLSVKSVINSNTEVARDFTKLFDKFNANTFVSSVGTALGQIRAQGSKMAQALLENVNDFTKNSNKSVGGLGDTINSVSVTGIAAMRNFAAQKFGELEIPGIASVKELETRMAQVDKISRQTSLSLGDGMEMGMNRARNATKGLNDTIAEMQSSFNASREDALAVAKVLSAGMGANQASDAVLRLNSRQEGLSKTLTTAEAAMAVATATGVSHSVITENMVTAYQQLGATQAESANMFGTIYGAAKESGIGFQKTTDAIMGGAKALKFYGASAESVTPIFNAFAKSLDKGRKGLAPELFEGVISGIKGMDTATRAFLGIQGGMGGGNALQAGFEMEAAMAEGPEGMKKVMDNVMDTLKKFGGGRITTLQEAAKDPEAARNYQVQRDLLGQLLHVTGDKANMTMTMLSKNQDAGMQISTEQARHMEEMVKGADIVASETSTTGEKSAAQLSAAIDKSAETLKGELTTLLKGSAFQTIMRGLDTTLKTSIRTGRLDVAPLRDAVGGRRQRRQDPDQPQPRRAQRTTADNIEAAGQLARGRAPAMPERADTPNIDLDPIRQHISDLFQQLIEKQGQKTLPESTLTRELPPLPQAATPASQDAAQALRDMVTAAKPIGPDAQQVQPPLPPEPPPLLPGGPGTRVEPPPQPEEDKFGFSINRAMEQYRKMRESEKQPVPVTQTERAEEAITMAQEAAQTPAGTARQNINTTADIHEQQRIQQAAAPVAATPEAATARTARAQPEELEVKIKITMEGGRLNLTPVMEEQVLRIIKGQHA